MTTSIQSMRKADIRHVWDTYKLLNGDNKELMIIPGANHTDLYDNMDKIPFDKLEDFFLSYLE